MFPHDVAATTLESDIVFVSESTKQVVLLKLTEDCLERKFSKHTGLASDCQQAGWRTKGLLVEVGLIFQIFGYRKRGGRKLSAVLLKWHRGH